MSHIARRLALVAGLTLVAALPLVAQAPAVSPAPPSWRLELDLLAGPWLPGRSDSERQHPATVVRGFTGAAAAMRLRIPLGDGAWGVLVSATIAQAGTVIEQEAQPWLGMPRQPVRGYGASFGDAGVGLEYRWRLGARTALLAGIEATMGRFRRPETSCSSGAGRDTCDGFGPRIVGANWGPTVAPSLGLTHQLAPRAALVATLRHASLKLGERSTTALLVGVRVVPGTAR